MWSLSLSSYCARFASKRSHLLLPSPPLLGLPFTWTLLFVASLAEDSDPHRQSSRVPRTFLATARATSPEHKFTQTIGRKTKGIQTDLDSSADEATEDTEEERGNRFRRSVGQQAEGQWTSPRQERAGYLKYEPWWDFACPLDVSVSGQPRNSVSVRSVARNTSLRVAYYVPLWRTLVACL